MDNSLRELYQEVILDHSRHPRHYGVLDGATHKAEGYNPLCGDRVTVYLVLDTAGRVTDIKFEGKGCAISQASASMMTQKIKGKSKDEAAAVREDFRRIVMGDGAPSNEDALGELILLEGVQKFPQRVKCAMLAWRALEQALDSK